jgi:tRNA threonylcarbamoyladenosine biosynthesis protein TsaB
LILILETSSIYCSIAICNLDGAILYNKIAAKENAHAELLPAMVHEAIVAQNLKALAINAGPGSYTGLRIGTSLAKGLCYALKLPLIAVSGLRGLASQGKKVFPNAEVFISLLDARRDEAYAAVFNHELKPIQPIHFITITKQSFHEYANKSVIINGNCAVKMESIGTCLEQYKILNSEPRAEYYIDEAIAAFEEKKFENLAYFEPYYLKEYIPGIAKKAAKE